LKPLANTSKCVENALKRHTEPVFNGFSVLAVEFIRRLSVDKYQQLLAAQEEREDWRELVRQAREQVRADLGERELTPPEDVLREIREERDEQLVALR
jgi:hypothetical protein